MPPTPPASLLDLPASLLARVAVHLERKDLGRLACCSRDLRGRTYRAWPADAEALRLAARAGNLALLHAQLEASPGSVDAPGDFKRWPKRTALLEAATAGHEAMVQALLAAGYKGVDFATYEDADLWRPVQLEINATPGMRIVEDGIAGPATLREAASRLGMLHGQMVQRPGD